MLEWFFFFNAEQIAWAEASFQPYSPETKQNSSLIWHRMNREWKTALVPQQSGRDTLQAPLLHTPILLLSPGQLYGHPFQGKENKWHQLQKPRPACPKAVSLQRAKPVVVSLQQQSALVSLANAVTATNHFTSLPGTPGLGCSLPRQSTASPRGCPAERGLWGGCYNGRNTPGLSEGLPGRELVALSLVGLCCHQPNCPGSGAAGAKLPTPPE